MSFSICEISTNTEFNLLEHPLIPPDICAFRLPNISLILLVLFQNMKEIGRRMPPPNMGSYAGAFVLRTFAETYGKSFV